MNEISPIRIKRDNSNCICEKLLNIFINLTLMSICMLSYETVALNGGLLYCRGMKFTYF